MFCFVFVYLVIVLAGASGAAAHRSEQWKGAKILLTSNPSKKDTNR